MKIRHGWQFAVLLTGAAGLAGFSMADAQAQESKYELAIPAQSLGSALRLLADQTGLQLLFFSDLVEGKQAPAVNGSYSVDQALDAMLQGTGLVHQYLDDKGSITVRAKTPALTDVLPFRIQAQDANDGLAEFARQSGQQLDYLPAAAIGVNANAVEGQMTAIEALQKLLQGTGLDYSLTNTGVINVRGGSGADAGTTTDPTGTTTLTTAVADVTDKPVEATVTTGRSGGIEEIIVTAQKKSENIQDVPIAITALSMEDLTQRQIAGGPDLFTQVPNMSFTKTNFTGYSIQIRGIGTQAVSATTDPAVAVALNNTPFIHNRFFEQEFYDLERLEVLRGPQGTLYGRNATAGVVNLISAKPKFYSEARSSLDIGNYNSHRIEQMINIPLVEDVAALRFAGEWTKRDGYSENQLTGNPVDGRDLWSTRTSLRVKPNDDLDINLMWEHFQENDDRLRSGKQLCDKDLVTNVAGFPVGPETTLPEAGQYAIWSGAQASFSQGCKRNSLYSKDSYQTPEGLMLPYYAPLAAIGLPAALHDPYSTATQPHDLRKIQSTIDPAYRANSDITELQINWDLGNGLTLTSETGYDDDSVYSREDFNRFNTAPGAWDVEGNGSQELLDGGVLHPDGTFCDPQLGCSDRLVGEDIASSDSKQFSQELRLSSNFDGPFNFSVGANYLHFDTLDKYYVFFNSISLIAAANPYRLDPRVVPPPYVPGRSDNSGCLIDGYAPGDPNGVYSVTSCTYMDPNPIDHVNDRGHNYFLSNNPYKLNSYGIFGETYWNIADNLKLTTGFRWSVDQKSAPRVPTWILDSNSVGYPVADVTRQDWREPTGRVALDWKPKLSFTDQTLLYGSYSHGYKAGGANPPGYVRSFYGDPNTARASAAQSATRPRIFKAEYVNAFELGTKNTLLDGRLTANLDAFYYKYKNYQISEIVDRSAYNHNYDANIWGAELELDWFALDNLRFGFKGGYENARFAKGEKAVDLMDRTAGDPDWTLHRPFPTYASSCILPTSLFRGVSEGFGAPAGDPELVNLGGVGGGSAGPCELVYQQGFDPVTEAPYDAEAYANGTTPETGIYNTLSLHPGYRGFDPTDPAMLAYTNNGEGIAKNIGGNDLPNAPHYTLTLTGDYTLPLANAWTATLHVDTHWQSASYWRVFDDSPFSRLKPYYTMNVAAIFVNEAAGWNVMAYVKNVTNKTAITGAFLNSDDTGLTTNVFLTDPRLYGIRVTKTWEGNGLLHGFGARRESGKPYPLTLEVGGQLQHVDAPNEPLLPSFEDQFAGRPIDIFAKPQDKDLGWGEGREIKLAWRPAGGLWSLALAYRYGETHNNAHDYAEQLTEPVCILAGGPLDAYCDPDAAAAAGLDPIALHFTEANNGEAIVAQSEKHNFFDFLVSRDFAFGGLSRSAVGLGLRRARFESRTNVALNGIPDYNIPENVALTSAFPGNVATFTLYTAEDDAGRKFKGTGPILTWNAAQHLFGNEKNGYLDLDWSVTVGVLFGDQNVMLSGAETARMKEMYVSDLGASTIPPFPSSTTETNIGPTRRHKSVDAPLFGASLGLSYQVGGINIGADYRWERYFNVIDGGFDAHKNEDRTIQGPHLKASIGFGG